MSLHKSIGFLVWIPFTGDRVHRDRVLVPEPRALVRQRHARQARLLPLGRTGEEVHVGEGGRSATPSPSTTTSTSCEARYPDRTIQDINPPTDKTGVYMAWVSRGFDPWTREGGAGNAYVFVDQYSGKVVYDGIPEEGNVFDQAWDDWSFPLHTGDWGGPVTARRLGRDRALAHRARGHRRDHVRGPAQQAGEARPAGAAVRAGGVVRRAQRAAAGDGDPWVVAARTERHAGHRRPAVVGALRQRTAVRVHVPRAPRARAGARARWSCWRYRCCSRCTHSASRRRCGRSGVVAREGRVTGAVFAATPAVAQPAQPVRRVRLTTLPNERDRPDGQSSASGPRPGAVTATAAWAGRRPIATT